MTDSELSILERAIGAAVGGILYREFKPMFRRAEVRVRIRRHVQMAKGVKEEVEEVQRP